MKSKYIFYLAFACIMIITFLSCSCDNSSKNAQDNKIIEELQKNVPFTIIVPTYFPRGIAPRPTAIYGPGKGASDNSISLGLTYQKKGIYNSIHNTITLYEENYIIEFLPSGDSSVFLNI